MSALAAGKKASPTVTFGVERTPAAKMAAQEADKTPSEDSEAAVPMALGVSRVCGAWGEPASHPTPGDSTEATGCSHPIHARRPGRQGVVAESCV